MILLNATPCLCLLCVSNVSVVAVVVLSVAVGDVAVALTAAAFDWHSLGIPGIIRWLTTAKSDCAQSKQHGGCAWCYRDAGTENKIDTERAKYRGRLSATMWLRLLTATRIHALMVSATATTTEPYTSCDRQTKRRVRLGFSLARFDQRVQHGRGPTCWHDRHATCRSCHYAASITNCNKEQQGVRGSYLSGQQHLSIWPLWWQRGCEVEQQAAHGARLLAQSYA